MVNHFYSPSITFVHVAVYVLQVVSRACMMLVHMEPLLGLYTDLVRYYMAVSLGVHRSTGKLLSVLASIFRELAQKVPRT